MAALEVCIRVQVSELAQLAIGQRACRRVWPTTDDVVGDLHDLITTYLEEMEKLARAQGLTGETAGDRLRRALGFSEAVTS